MSYTRRDWIRRSAGVAGLAGAVLAESCGGGPNARAARVPNIVLILGDDMTYTDAGCYGNAEVRTPNIDRLAREGMKFTRCYTAAPMCSPTRQMIYTGLFPVRNGAYPNHAKVNDGVKSMVQHLGDAGYRVGIAGKRHYWPAEVFAFEDISGTPLEFGKFEEFMRRDPEQPYCLVVCSNEPHSPWNQGNSAEYDARALRVPPYLVDTPETRDVLSRYYAEITYLDGQVARTLEFIRQSGQEDNTLVMFNSEQGSSLPHCKWTLYETGIRTQLIARWPGRIPAGTETMALVQGCDLLPTWMEAAGVAPPADLDGRSFLSVLEGKAERHRDYVYGIQTTRGIFHGSDCYPIRSVCDGRFKYIWNLNAKEAFRNTVTARDQQGFYQSWREKAKNDADAAEKVRLYEQRPEEEFYDLETDPFEMRNSAREAEHRGRMDALRRELETWMAQQGDRGIATEMEAIEHQNPGRSEIL